MADRDDPRGKASSPRRLRREQRLALIMSAAEEVFAEQGYAGASMDTIAQRAGISVPVLYDYFESKAAMYLSLVERHEAALLAAVTAAVAEGGNAEERMRFGVDAFLRFAEGDPRAWRILVRDPPADPAVVERYTRQQAVTSAAVAVLIDRELVALRVPAERTQAAEVFAELMRTGLDGLAEWWHEHPDVPRERLVELVMDAYWHGLARLTRQDAPPASPDGHGPVPHAAVDTRPGSA